MAFTLAGLELEPSFSVSLNTFSLDKLQLDSFASKAKLSAGLYCVFSPFFFLRTIQFDDKAHGVPSDLADAERL